MRKYLTLLLFSTPDRGTQSSPETAGGGQRATDRTYQVIDAGSVPTTSAASTGLTWAESCGLTQSRTPPREPTWHSSHRPEFHYHHSPNSKPEFISQCPHHPRRECAEKVRMFQNVRKCTLVTIIIDFTRSVFSFHMPQVPQFVFSCVSSERM